MIKKTKKNIRANIITNSSNKLNNALQLMRNYYKIKYSNINLKKSCKKVRKY